MQEEGKQKWKIDIKSGDIQFGLVKREKEKKRKWEKQESIDRSLRWCVAVAASEADAAIRNLIISQTFG